MNLLTATEARNLFRYDTGTGLLYNRTNRSNKSRAGTQAGGINDKGYLKVKVNKQLYSAHRLIWLMQYGRWPTDQIDHIDHDRLNNRLSNLREVSNFENHRNLRLRTDNLSGISGVFLDKKSKKWCVSIGVNGSVIYLGRFGDIGSATIARKKAEIDYGFHVNHGLG